MDELEKALEEIVRNFLFHETKATDGRKSEISGKKEDNIPAIHEIPVPGDEFITDLHQCLAERGVLREIHALLRQRLVEILKGSYPDVVASGCDDAVSVVSLKLFEDFLCCHNLLFTYSVLSSELDGKLTKGDFGKLSSTEAESLLEELQIPKNTGLSQRILKQYSEKQRASLLECVLGVTTWGDKKDAWMSPRDEGAKASPATSQGFAVGEQKVDGYPGGQFMPNLDGGEERYLQLQILMERDKQAQIKTAMQRFREEETQRIRDELQTKLKFEFIAKEKELLRNYDERVAHMKSILDREKEIWAAEKARKEKELFSQKQDLIKLMEHVKEKKKKLQDALDNLQGTKASEDPAMNRSGEKPVDSSVASEESSSDSNSRRSKLMKNIELESIVRRLQTENTRLKGKTSRYGQPSFGREILSPLSDHDRFPSPKRSSEDDDKIALLQYTVEKQTEELENLKKQLRDGYQQPKATESSDKLSRSAPDQDLENFLADSKRRFAEIEKKAELVGSSLKDVFNRSSSSSFKLSSPGKAVLPSKIGVPTAPKIPSILKQPRPMRHAAVATEVLGTGLSTSAETLKSFLIDQADETYTSKYRIPDLPRTHQLLLTRFDDGKASSSSVAASTVITVAPPVPVPGAYNVKSSPPNPQLNLVQKPIPTSGASPVSIASQISVTKSPKSTVITAEPPMGLPPAFAPPSSPTEVPDKSESSEKSGNNSTKSNIEKHNQEPINHHLRNVPPAVSKRVEIIDPTTSVGRPSATVSSPFSVPPTITTSSIHVSQPLSTPPLATTVDFPLPSQKSAPVVSIIPEETNAKAPMALTASSSGALIQTKVPNVGDARQRATAASFPEPSGSGGDALVKTKVGKTVKRRGSSSENSMSFPDISHADGDTFEFMTEEDFWAI